MSINKSWILMNLSLLLGSIIGCNKNLCTSIRSNPWREEKKKVKSIHPAKQIHPDLLTSKKRVVRLQIRDYRRGGIAFSKSKTLGVTCLTARSSPESRFIPMYTVPNAPRPINWPFLHEIGGGISTVVGGGGEEEGLIRALDLRMQEVILSARTPGKGGWFSWLSSSPGGRKTRDRRTDPKKSCISTIWGFFFHTLCGLFLRSA